MKKGSAGKSKIRVLIADPHPVVRKGFQALLDGQMGAVIVGEAADGEEAVEMALERTPDVVILAWSMPKMDGLQTTHLLQKNAPQVRIILFATAESNQFLRKAFQGGASGFLLKTVPLDQLVQAVEAVFRGQLVFPPRVAKAFGASREREQQDSARLTKREKEVLVHIAQGWTSKEIAHILSLSMRTVEAHRQHIRAKLNIHTLADLIRYAIAERWAK